MKTLEDRAKAEYWDLADEAGGVHRMAKELVALGIVTEAHEADGVVEGDSIMWYELENTAAADGSGRGEFFVDGTNIFETLRRAADQLGYLRIGADTRRCIDAMLRERVCVIWHTHTATIDPSREDVAEFPRWLADAGMVYHVPTGITTVYNESGIIYSSAALPATALVSSEDVP